MQSLAGRSADLCGLEGCVCGRCGAAAPCPAWFAALFPASYIGGTEAVAAAQTSPFPSLQESYPAVPPIWSVESDDPNLAAILERLVEVRKGNTLVRGHCMGRGERWGEAGCFRRVKILAACLQPPEAGGTSGLIRVQEI